MKLTSSQGMISSMLTIGEVAERANLATSALRFYEREGLVSAVRSDGGQRRYQRDVLRRLAFVRAAQRVGLTLDEIREALATLPEGRTPTAADWKRLSRSWRPLLNRRISELERVRDKLDTCIGCGCLSLKVCHLLNPHDIAAAEGPGPRWLLDEEVSAPVQ
jgi:MerR family transcriptional regulator, redox-sensitive transcriptional activator SoxR